MIAIIQIVTALVILLTGISSLYADSLSPIGLWKTIDDETGEAKSVVRIWNEQGQLSGKVETIFSKPGKNPNPICEKCSGDRKDQPVIGMAILWGLAEDHEEWNGGYILDPKNGKTYKCEMKLEDGGKKLTVRGYIGFSLLGRSQTWIRVAE